MSHSRPPGSILPPSIPGPVPILLRDLVHERTGLFFEDERLSLMLDKLNPRATELRCASFLDYYYLLKYDEGAANEWRRVMDLFSVQETYFWREFDQIQALVGQIVPEWFQRTDQPLRIWSAACATGEEPYTIVMALEEAGWGRHPIEVVASDASEAALAKARAGQYRERSFRALPAALRARYFRPDGELNVLDPAITARVTFRWANLAAPESYADLGDLPVIFCRNVFIYFSNTAIQRVVREFARRIPMGGNLFIGASESLLKLTEAFELQEVSGAFVYRRKQES